LKERNAVYVESSTKIKLKDEKIKIKINESKEGHGV
jgi:hypothetical protein